MRGIVRAIAAASVLCACVQQPQMALEEARRVLASVSAGRGQTDLCTDEGRATFRAATRAYAAAMEAEGKEWPDLEILTEGPANAIEGTVVAALAAGFIKPTDLRGEVRQIAHALSFAMAIPAREVNPRQAIRAACPEFFELHQTLARHAIDSERDARAMARARESGSSQRVMALSRRQVEREQRFTRRVENITARLNARLEEAGFAVTER